MIKNQIKTVVFLGVLTALLLWIGSLFGGAGLTFAIIFVLGMNLVTYFYSDKIVLKMYKAQEVKEKDQPKLYAMVKRLSQGAKLPMPKLYIIPTETPNAFAAGRDPKHAAVAVTQGIMKVLNKEELEGVLAHELSHVKNRDILIATIAASIAGIIAYVAMIARFTAIFGGMGGDRDNNIIELLLMSILIPIIATVVQLAISRSREYIADESGARLIKNPKALASALIKIEHEVKKTPLRFGNQATASLFITNPFTVKGLMTLFSTHPSTKDRVKKLEAIKC
ncbi:MAG: zinc metalloprotease HtpX [archaeon]